MKNTEILQKAIEKAYPTATDILVFKEPLTSTAVFFILHNKHSQSELCTYRSVRDFIFSHDFAKAFWKDTHEATYTDKYERAISEEWQYHLQQMVISDNPIKYLEQFL